MALTFVMECPLYNPNIDEFPSMFQNAAVGSPKYFYQLDHQIDSTVISQKYIAFRHSNNISHFDPHHDVLLVPRAASLAASWTLISISLLDSK